ncbi:hypothetical protein EPI10_010388 [Gossypium australe]|uniref:Uncharacterized protein n=1 Tax=Gossypium australe TaxID=47621 RepID=A0A5B6W574_9ROSI|nr:hypothetical protein EPI10_010388 [Gossypium australe]
MDGMWAMLGQSSPLTFSQRLCRWGHATILSVSSAVRLRIPWGNDIKLQQFPIANLLSKVRFRREERCWILLGNEGNSGHSRINKEDKPRNPCTGRDTRLLQKVKYKSSKELSSPSGNSLKLLIRREGTHSPNIKDLKEAQFP